MKATMILADPAWQYNNRHEHRKIEHTDGSVRCTFGVGASGHYLTESTEQMATIPVADLAADRCHLYMWATWPFLPDALWLMNAWGFEYKTCAFVWVKVNAGRWKWSMRRLAATLLSQNNLERFLDWLAFYGVGHYTASNTEYALVGVRGRYYPPTKAASQVIFGPNTKKADHSRKPDTAHERIMAMYPSGHIYAELFARRQYPGWVCFGNEIDGMDMRESIPRYLEHKRNTR